MESLVSDDVNFEIYHECNGKPLADFDRGER